MKLFMCAMLIALPVLLTSCFSCSHHFEYTKVETTQTFPAQPISDSLIVNKDALSKDYPSLGKVLKTRYFDFSVYKLVLSDNKSALPNQMKIEPEEGYRFLILYLTVKKKDQVKIKNLKEGEVWIYKDGWQYKYMASGSVKTEVEGKSFWDEKNLADNSIVLVYKIPKAFKGAAYFQPAALKMDERISLGNI